MLEKIINKYYSRQGKPDVNAGIPEAENLPISENLNDNLSVISDIFGDESDFIIRKFTLGKIKTEAAIICIDGLADAKTINQNILKPLMYDDFGRNIQMPKNIEDIKNYFLSVGEVKTANTFHDGFSAVLSGNTLLLVDRICGGIIINSKGYSKRSINDPMSESVIRGPRESFIENLRTNTSLIRRKIQDPALVVKTIKAGRKTRTNISVLYLKNIAKPELVENVIKKIQSIDTDAILDSGYIEQFISEKSSPLFPIISNTEKPDVAAAKILEGRVAVIVDGSPYALTMPMYFIESFQTAEDYYIHPIFASFLRFIRFTAFIISLFALPFYVALTTFHQELIPTSLLFTMAASASGTPFPAVIEAIIMIFAFEILKESGVRLPRPVGQAVSMVGAIIIGETAISAGILSAPMSIVVAITAVSAFAVPSQSNASSVLRIALTLLAGILGGYGVILGVMAVLIHLSSIRSFGTPYLAPFNPLRFADLKDSLLRLPHKSLLTRPEHLGDRNPHRSVY